MCALHAEPECRSGLAILLVLEHCLGHCGMLIVVIRSKMLHKRIVMRLDSHSIEVTLNAILISMHASHAACTTISARLISSPSFCRFTRKSTHFRQAALQILIVCHIACHAGHIMTMMV